jgi:hypothetical protein
MYIKIYIKINKYTPPVEWPKTFIFLGSKDPLLEYSYKYIRIYVYIYIHMYIYVYIYIFVCI